MKQKLYRHFDEDDNLLYVGISMSVAARLACHKSSSHWFDKIKKITIENFGTREEVLDAEIKAIQLEKPKFNVQNSLLDYRNLTGDNAVFIGASAVAKKIGVDQNTLYRMIVTGEFNVKPSSFFLTRKWRVQDVEKFITEGNPEDRPIYSRKKNSRMQIRYLFNHAEHGEVIGSQSELVNAYGLDASAVHRLTTGKRPIHKGWTLNRKAGDV